MRGGKGCFGYDVFWFLCGGFFVGFFFFAWSVGDGDGCGVQMGMGIDDIYHNI